MSFLNSLMLFGGAAVAIPIIIHFLNRRRFRTVTWAAMKFVQLSVEQNQRRIRLEDLILLLVRCAILALLAFALARPVLKSSTTDVLGQAKVTGVIVLDNSYSMDLLGEDGNATAFEQARAAAKATLDAMPTGSRVAVLLASDVVQGVIDEPTHDLNQAREVIERAKVSDHATDLYPAMVRAMEILEGRAVLRKEIYLITDGQASGWQQSTDIQKLITKNQDDIDVYVLRVGDGKPARNWAITKIDNYDGLTPVGHPLRFEVVVSNNDDQVAEDVAVSLYVGTDSNAVDTITVPTVTARGTTAVTLYASLKQPGHHEIRAAFPNLTQADGLGKDNQNRLVVNAVEKVRVLMVHDEDATRTLEDPEHECYFLNIALAPVSDHYVEVVDKPSANFLEGGLDRYTAVILTNVRQISDDQIKALKSYLQQGGGLIFFPGDRVDLNFYNDQLFKEHGLLPSPWGDATGDPAQDEQFVEFQKRDFEHPVTALWNNPKYTGLGMSRTFSMLPLDEHASAAQPSLKEAGPVSVLLRFSGTLPQVGEKAKASPGAPPAIMDRQWGGGLVYQFSSTADKDWSDLPVRGSSMILMHRIVGSVQARQDTGLNLRVGEPFIHSLDPLRSDQEGFVLFSNQTNSLTAAQLNDQPVLRFEDTHHAGVYQFQLKGETDGTIFVVQHDARESDLRKIADTDLPVPAGSIIHWDPKGDFAAKVKKARVGAEYWLLILLVVLALVGLETYLAQKFSHSK